MGRISITDHVQLTARKITPQGFLVAPGVISRSGVFNYRAAELELRDRDPNAIVKVYRSFDETAKAVSSFDGVSVTMNHPRGGINAATWRDLALGDVRSPVMAGNNVEATLTVRDQKAIDAIQKGRRHLSCGYTFELVANQGRTDSGDEYEFEQHEIQGNHVAIVDSPRCGPSCRIGDSDDDLAAGDGAPRNNHTSNSSGGEKPFMELIIDGMIFKVDDANLVFGHQRAAIPAGDAGEGIARLQPWGGEPPAHHQPDRGVDAGFRHSGFDERSSD
jgi:hypothetical protein